MNKKLYLIVSKPVN